MSIILNEREWAKDAIQSKELGKHPYETLTRVAKYYAADYSRKDTRNKLEYFLIQCQPSISTVTWGKTLDSAVKYAYKHPLIEIEYLEVTDREMEGIDSLPGRQLRRLAFTLLCIAKFQHTVDPGNPYWVNLPDTEIRKLTNTKASVKRQSLLYKQLRDAGMIAFSKKVSNLNVQVLFAEEGEPVLYIHDFRNLGYQYEKHHGGNYFECACCGVTEKIENPNSGRRQKYCHECAAKMRSKQKAAFAVRRK